MLPHILFLSLLLASGLSGAQTTGAAPVTDLGGSLLQLVLSLAGVLALLVGSLWLIKKLMVQRGGAGGMLRVISGTAVGARERVVIVEVGSTWLVLGVAPGRVSALAEIPRQSIPPPAPSEAVKGFPEWLKNLSQNNK
mgnify:CR=1 FL=1